MKEKPCEKCGTAWQGRFCFDCAKAAIPGGPPLQRLRRFGFKVPYRQRVQMRQSQEISGAIPTECDESQSIKMSHRFVACDGMTYIGHEWISPGGSGLSWSEAYPSKKEQAAGRF